jgi:hypothetical protein
MEQLVMIKVNNYWNTKTTFYLDTSGDQNFNASLTAVHFISTTYDWTYLAPYNGYFSK